MAKKRSPETFEKRRRALDKQRKRNEKISDRVLRNAEKKSIKDGTYTPRMEQEREPEPPDWRDNFKFGE